MCPLLKCETFQMTDKNVTKTYLILLYLPIPPWKIRVSSNTIHIWQHSWKQAPLILKPTVINKIQRRRYQSYKKGIWKKWI